MFKIRLLGAKNTGLGQAHPQKQLAVKVLNQQQICGGRTSLIYLKCSMAAASRTAGEKHMSLAGRFWQCLEEDMVSEEESQIGAQWN